jgi:hypothetical protein
MNTAVPLSLEFGEDVPPKVQARMSYAFRVFAAIYGHQVVDQDQCEKSVRCIYGRPSVNGGGLKRRHLPARYVLRGPEHSGPPPVQHSLGEESVYLFHGRDTASGNPDWLAEIFEWLSSADEMSIRERDSIGRIPYARSIFARYGISPGRAYASLIMAWLESFIRGQAASEPLPAAPSPLPDVSHLVISSHDLDFYFAGRWGSLARVLKNLGIAVLVARSYPFFKDSFRQLVRIARGCRVGDYLPQLLERSRKNGCSSTVFVLVRRGHRRDGNYALEQVAHRLCEIPRYGSTIALHGSYSSIVEHSDLSSEVALLEAQMGERPQGSRQHWLRFDRPEKLFSNIEKAGLHYDSSWGWSQQVGFRNGAAFAFPPYNFTREEPYNFLLIPLVLMDQGLQVARRTSAEQPGKVAEAVLQESRRWGWGGISVLWHNPIEPLSTCDDVNQVFWQQLKNKGQHQERWISAEEFVSLSLRRYQTAGLLQGLSPETKKSRAADRHDPAGLRFSLEALEPAAHPGAI